MSDPCFVIRVAIALTVLKYKPKDQSTASYLLGLRSHFPVATNDDISQDWQTYALDLEKRLATLQAQRDADQERKLLSKLPVDVPDAPPPKKKSKKNTSKEQPDPEWSWDQSRADWSRVLSSQYPSSPSLVTVYASLRGVLAAPNTDASRLSGAILRALDAIHLFFFSPPNLDSDAQTVAPPQLKPEYIDSTRIALASPLLMYVLRTALHTLVRTAQDITMSKRPRQRPRMTTLSSTDACPYLDKVVDHLLEYILLPLVRAIAPLCSARLAPLHTTPPKKRTTGKGKGKHKTQRTSTCTASIVDPSKTDVRTDVFALLGTSLAALEALPPSGNARIDGASISSGVRDRVGLETIRELDALYAVPDPPPPSVPSSATAPSSTPQQPSTTPPNLPPSRPSPPSLSAPSPTPSASHPLPRPPTTQARPLTDAVRARRLDALTGTRAQRVRALATRDAGWRLASTLSVCVAGSLHTGTTGGGVDGALGGRALRDALLDRIGRLVRSVPVGVHEAPSASVHGNASDIHALGPDSVCRNMLLAICERAMSHLASS